MVWCCPPKGKAAGKPSQGISRVGSSTGFRPVTAMLSAVLLFFAGDFGEFELKVFLGGSFER
jgi:hypothetical protein